MAARALLVVALVIAAAGAAPPPQAVDVAPRQLSDPAPAAGLVGVYHRFVDFLLCRHASTAFGGAAAPPPISLARSSARSSTRPLSTRCSARAARRGRS